MFLKTLILLTAVMLSSCATNGGPFDPAFYGSKIHKAVDVVDEVVVVVTTPFDVDVWNEDHTVCYTLDSNKEKVDCNE